MIKELLKMAFNAGYDCSLMHNNGETKGYYDFDEFYKCEISTLNSSVSDFFSFAKYLEENFKYYKDLEPIKLNDGLLALYGFKRDGLGNMCIDLMTHFLSLRFADGYYYPLYAQVPEMSHEDEQRVFINRIESLHELQNLFFAITGKELKIIKK